MKVCGKEVEFKILSVKDEVDIISALKDQGFAIGTLGSQRVNNIYSLAKGLVSIDDHMFGADFKANVDWLLNLSAITLDYLIQAWSRYMEVEVSKFEEAFTNQEVKKWPIPILPSDFGSTVDMDFDTEKDDFKDGEVGEDAPKPEEAK